ncbi:MAG TPA: glycosyltransferase [Pseudacidobacterium sp.]|nr:glycosyltransferase [Pseudacidobacterium sp.]
MGLKIARFNQEVLNTIKHNRINVLFSDKAISLSPATLRKLRKMGVFTIDYFVDNPFGPRKDPGYRLFKKALPEFDLHAVPRQVSVKDFKDHGGREVITTLFGYDRDILFPPPRPLTDGERNRNVSFIGSPYDNRAEIFTLLWRENISLDISGAQSRWEKALSPDVMQAIFRDGELLGSAYREALWKSKINLSFVTKSNLDEIAHRSLEITAAGAFMLAERTPRHLEMFKEDEEAVFFSSLEECIVKIRKYLGDEAARNRIAAAGHARAVASGYDHDSVIRKILERAAENIRQGEPETYATRA